MADNITYVPNKFKSTANVEGNTTNTTNTTITNTNNRFASSVPKNDDTATKYSSHASSEDTSDVPQNPLNDYDNVSYNLELFIPSCSDMIQYTNARNSGSTYEFQEKLVIAKSGVTEIGIDNLTINTILASNSLTKNVTTTNIDFTLVEPFGINLLDQLLAYSHSYNYQGSISSMPLILHLSFNGYDTETGEAKPLLNDKDGIQLQYEFPLKLLNIVPTVNTGSTLYKMSTIAYDQLGFDTNSFVLNNAITIDLPDKNLDTFSKLLSNIQDTINNNLKNGKLKHWGLSTYVQFAYDKSLEIFNSKFIDIPSTNQQIDNVSTDKRTYTFLTNDTIQTIVEKISNDLVYVHEDKATNKTKTVIRVVPIFELKKVHEVTKEPIGITTYYLIPVVNDKIDTNIISSNIDKNTIIDDVAKRLIRKYNYIYTGKNDSVLDCKINLDIAYMSILSRGLTQFSANTTAQISQLNPKDTNVTDITKSTNGTSTNDKSVASNSSNKLSNSSDNNSLTKTSNTTQSSNGGTSSNKTNRITYLSDVDSSVNSLSDTTSLKIPQNVSTPQTNSGNKSGPINPNLKAETRMNALEQAYSTTCMLQMSLTIKGDPIYLGTTINTKNKNHTTRYTKDNSSYNIPGIDKTVLEPPNVMIAFKTVNKLDEDTGELMIKDSMFLKGIYSVRTVQSTFDSGKFTQVLDMFKLSDISSSDIVNSNNSTVQKYLKG